MVQSSTIKPQWFRFSKIRSHIQCMAHMREFNLYNYLLEESYQNGCLILPYHLSAFRLCALKWYYFDPNIFVLRYLAIYHSQFRGADLQDRIQLYYRPRVDKLAIYRCCTVLPKYMTFRLLGSSEASRRQLECLEGGGAIYSWSCHLTVCSCTATLQLYADSLFKKAYIEA